MQSEFKDKVSRLEKIFGIQSQDKNLLKNALTHSSYTKENDSNVLENYERLEFLGDAVLKLCISNFLYKKFPEYSEGELTKIRSILVSDNFLAELALKLGFKPLLILGRQEDKMGGREKKSILACAFEAVLGAYSLDGKYEELASFLGDTFDPWIQDIDEHFEKFNAKAVLQEYTQSQNKKLPDYHIVDEIGPEHDKIFVVEVSYMDEVLASGQGKTKRDAEQEGAYKACQKLGII